MLAVQSLFFSESYRRFNNSKKNTPEYSTKFSEISCKLLNSHGYTTTLFIQEKYYSLFKHIPYKQIFFFDNDEFEFLPKDFWSASKLICLAKLNEPFIHFDLDLFLLKDLSNDIKNQDFFMFHSEPWIDNLNIHKKFINDLTGSTLNSPLVSHNAAILGGLKFDVIKTAAKFVIKYAIENNDILEDQIKKDKNYHYTKSCYKSIFLEQILMVRIILSNLNMNQPITVLTKESASQEDTLQEMIKHDIIHLWGRFYYHIEKTLGIDNFIKKLSLNTRNIDLIINDTL
jgi:hypothetical protein